MQGRLAGLTSEFNSTAQSANRLLGSLMNRNRDVPAPETQEAKSQPTAPPQTSRRRSDIPPSLQWSSSDLSPSLERAQQQQEEMDNSADAIASTQQPAKSPRARAERPRTVRPKLAKRSEESQEPESGTTSTQGRSNLMSLCKLHCPTPLHQHRQATLAILCSSTYCAR